MNELLTHVAGNVTNDPVMRRSASGTHYAYFTVANNVRRPLEGGGFADVATNFIDVRVFGDRLAANVATSLHRGDPVHLYGALSLSEYTNKDGEQVRRLQLVARHVGHDLRWGQTQFIKITHTPSAVQPAADASDGAQSGPGFDGAGYGGTSPYGGDAGSLGSGFDLPGSADEDSAPPPREELAFSGAR